MDTITKVFTKYDDPVSQINVPSMSAIEVKELNDNTNLSIPETIWSFSPYYPMEIEHGLEGVIFVHYKRGWNETN